MSADLASRLNLDALIDPGVAVCKDGSMVAGWRVVGEDLESRSGAERSAQSFACASALNGFSKGVSFWVEFRRIRAENDVGSAEEFRELPLKIMQMERIARFERAADIFRNQTHLYVQFSNFGEARDLKARLAVFNEFRASVESRFGSVFKMERLARAERSDRSGESFVVDELLSGLASSLSERLRDLRIRPDNSLMKLDVLLSPEVIQDDLFGTMRVNGAETVLLAVDGFPPHTTAGVMDEIATLPFEVRWVSRFICLGTNGGKKEATKRRRWWTAGKTSLASQMTGTEDAHGDRFSARMEDEIEDVLAAINEGDQFGIYSGAFIISAPDGDRAALNKAANDIREVLLSRGFEARLETVNLLDAWLGSVPGQSHLNLRRPMVGTITFSDMIPLSSIWRGERFNPCSLFPRNSPALCVAKSLGGEPYWFNLHSGGVGHTLIFGPTGTGKSVLLGFLAANWMRYENARVIAFDKNRSIYSLTRHVGGRFIDLGSQKSGMNPVGGLIKLGKGQAAEWLNQMIALSSPSPDQVREARLQIDAALEVMDEGQTLADIANLIQSELAREVFAKYLGGDRDALFNSPEDTFAMGDWTVFETAGLFEFDRGTALLTIDYLFRRIEAQLDLRPTLIIIDEAWAFIQHPIFASRINAWLKELRKKNASVVMATQQISDATNSDLTSTLMENCPTKLFLPNIAARTPNGAAHYRNLGLTDAQVDLIARLEKYRDYYVTKPEGNRVIDMALGRVALNLVGRTSIADGVETDRRLEQDPDYWITDMERELEYGIA